MVAESKNRSGFNLRFPHQTEERKLDFGFSEEQEMLRDAAKRFLTDSCSTKFVRQMMADPTAHDAGFWEKLVGLGWPGLLIPENFGGQGGTFLDLTVIAEEAGKALLPGPFFAAAMLGAPAAYRRWLRRAKERIPAQNGRGQVHRDRRDCRGRGPLRRRRDRAEGDQKRLRLHADRGEILRSRRPRRRRDRRRRPYRLAPAKTASPCSAFPPRKRASPSPSSKPSI